MKNLNLKVSFLLALCCAGLILLLQIPQVSAFSLRELLGLENPDQESTQDAALGLAATDKKEGADSASASTAAAAQNPQLNLDYFTTLFANMNQQERDRVLADPAVFKQVVESEANNRASVSAALASNLERDENVEFLMRRGAEGILLEAYLAQSIRARLPIGFPDETRIREYYDSNPQQFQTPEQIHVWQIFLAKAEDGDAGQLAALRKKAEALASDLRRGRADFANIALAQSEHSESRMLAGYMGLLKTEELLSVIKAPLLKLKPGEISPPLESETGLHIVKRGAIVPAATLELEQARPRIREALLNQAGAQLRDEIFAQARKAFPQAIADEKIEEWRLRLRTDTAAGQPPPPAKPAG